MSDDRAASGTGAPAPVEPAPLPVRRSAHGRRLRTGRERFAEFQVLLPRLTPIVWVTPALVVACIVVFAAMVASGVSPIDPTTEDLAAWGAGFGRWTHAGEQWRLLTSNFLHLGPLHLGLNVLALCVIGVLVERLLGNLATLAVALFAGIGGALVSSLADPDLVSVGASGIVFGLGGALLAVWAVHRERIPREVMLPTMGTGSLLFNPFAYGPVVFLVLSLVMGFATPNVDNAAHVGGLVAGGVMGLVFVRPLAVGAGRSSSRYGVAAGLAVVLGVAVALSASGAAERHVERALVLADRGENDAAVALCDEALALDDSLALAHATRGWCLARIGSFAAGLQALDRAVALDPTDPWAQGKRGWCLGELGRFEEAVAAFELSTEGGSDDAWAHGSLAWCLGELGRSDEALRAIETALRLDPSEAWLHRKNGEILQALGRNPAAIAAYERALELDPDEQYARQALAGLRVR